MVFISEDPSTVALALLISTVIITMPVVNAWVGPRHVSVNEEYITVKARCSCSHYSDYNYHIRTWLNYCPYCKKHGTLTVQVGHGRHNPEGMIVCTKCDMDFCLVHGKEHIHGSNFYLKRYHKPKKIAAAKVKTRKDLILEKWKEFDFWKMN